MDAHPAHHLDDGGPGVQRVVQLALYRLADHGEQFGQPDIGGTPERFQNTFARISPQSYFDLALSWNIARKFAFRIIANNVFDKSPPIVPNSYQVALSRSNTAPQRYDALGRQIAIGTTINF